MPRSTTRRPVRQFTVTRVEVSNTRTGETFAIPGMVVTAAEIQAMIECRPYTAQVWCETCAESVADCPEIRKLVEAPAEWSTMGMAD